MASTPSTPAPGGKPPKQMSSRLLTMKFMQRAVASGPNSPASPASSSKVSIPGTPQNTAPEGNASSSAKRQKLSHLSETQTPAEEAFTPTRPADVRAALASAEATRQAALERSWRGEETKWAFAVRQDADLPQAGLKVEILNGRMDDEDGDRISNWRTEEGQGRKVFGRKQKHVLSKEESADDSDDSDGSDGSSHSDDSLDEQAREILNMPDPEPKRVQTKWKGRVSGGADVEFSQCYGCREFGHKRQNCPRRARNAARQSTVLGQNG